MDEPKVEATGRTTGIQYLVTQNGYIRYAISNRKMAVRLCEQIKEGSATNHGKALPPSGREKRQNPT